MANKKVKLLLETKRYVHWPGLVQLLYDKLVEVGRQVEATELAVTVMTNRTQVMKELFEAALKKYSVKWVREPLPKLKYRSGDVFVSAGGGTIAIISSANAGRLDYGSEPYDVYVAEKRGKSAVGEMDEWSEGEFGRRRMKHVGNISAISQLPTSLQVPKGGY